MTKNLGGNKNSSLIGLKELMMEYMIGNAVNKPKIHKNIHTIKFPPKERLILFVRKLTELPLFC